MVGFEISFLQKKADEKADEMREMVVGQKTCEIRNILRYYINKRCVWKKKTTAKKQTLACISLSLISIFC